MFLSADIYLRNPEIASPGIDARVEVEDFSLMDAERLGRRKLLPFGQADVALVYAPHRGVVGRPKLGQQIGKVVAELHHALSRDHDLEEGMAEGEEKRGRKGMEEGEEVRKGGGKER